LKGTPTLASDISLVEIYHDVNNNGLYESFPDVLLGSGTFSGSSPPTTTIPLDSFGFVVAADTLEKLLIIYDINTTATVGDYVGISMLDETYFNLPIGTTDIVSSLNFPIVTLPDTEITGLVGDIVGTIVDEYGDPIAGPTIILYNSTGDVLNITTANETGWFTFLDIDQATDEYVVEVMMTHYEPEVVMNIDVVAGDMTDLGTIVLQTNATINGRVQDNNRKGIVNARVELFDENGNAAKIVNTDLNGNYTFEGVGYGTYRIKVHATDYQSYTIPDTYTVDKDHLNVTVSDIYLNATQERFDWFWIVIIVIIIAIVLVTIFAFRQRKGKKPSDDKSASMPPSPPLKQ